MVSKEIVLMVSKGVSTCYKLNPNAFERLDVLMLSKGFKERFLRGGSPMVSKGLKGKVFQCFRKAMFKCFKDRMSKVLKLSKERFFNGFERFI